MTDLIQRARDVAGRLIAERPADFSGRVRKPAPIQKEAAAIIAELIERIEGLEVEMADLALNLSLEQHAAQYPRD